MRGRLFRRICESPAIASRLDTWLSKHPLGSQALEDLADVFDVPQFKHIYVGGDCGIPFYTSGDIFLLDRRPTHYLSRTQTKNLHKYVLKQGTVLLARSGQLGGIIGRPQFADSALDGATTSDHVIRVIARK